MLRFVAASALDIGALWMRMAATVHRPSRSAYPTLFGIVYAFSDICIAAHVANRYPKLNVYLFKVLTLRALLNCTRLFGASRTILQVDQKKNDEKSLQ